MESRRFVYILRSDSEPDRHYVGLTSDVADRLRGHNEGPCGVTVRYRPWSLVVALAG
jgi:putative endonuclease